MKRALLENQPSGSVEWNPRRNSGQITVGEAVEHIGIGRFQYRILLICGLFNSADAMEMLLLAVLAPVLRCEWLLQEYQVAMITTIVFLGSMIMAPMWGSFADRYGRKNVLLAVCIWISYYGFLTTFAPTFGWVLLLRGIVGAGISGAPQSLVFISEYIPSLYKTRVLVCYGVFWTIGSLFEIIVSGLIIPNVPSDSIIPGWRILVLLSSIPLGLVAITIYQLPESVRYLVTAGREDEAKLILDNAAKLNNKPKIDSRLMPELSENRGSVRELLKPPIRSVVMRCWVLYFAAAFAYYGLILLSSVLLDISQTDDCSLASDKGGTEGNETQTCSCTPTSETTYMSMLVSTFGEVGSTIVNIYILERYSYPSSMAFYLAVEGIIFLLLIPCGTPMVTTTLIFIMRGLSAANVTLLAIYIAEVFPTRIRSLALGSCAAMSRIGAILTPFVAQVLVQHDRRAALTVYSVVSFLAVFVSLSMPRRNENTKLSTVVGN